LEEECRAWREMWVEGSLPKARDAIPNSVREYVIERDARHCSYCSRGGNDWGTGDQPWHIDHVVPVGRGGPTVADNLTLSCARCNLQKGSMSPVQFLGWLKENGDAG